MNETNGCGAGLAGICTEGGGLALDIEEEKKRQTVSLNLAQGHRVGRSDEEAGGAYGKDKNEKDRSSVMY